MREERCLGVANRARSADSRRERGAADHCELIVVETESFVIERAARAVELADPPPRAHAVDQHRHLVLDPTFRPRVREVLGVVQERHGGEGRAEHQHRAVSSDETVQRRARAVPVIERLAGEQLQRRSRRSQRMHRRGARCGTPRSMCGPPRERGRGHARPARLGGRTRGTRRDTCAVPAPASRPGDRAADPPIRSTRGCSPRVRAPPGVRRRRSVRHRRPRRSPTSACAP